MNFNRNEEKVSGAWTTKRSLKEKRQELQKEKKESKLRHSDLMWAAKRRYLNEQEWVELHMLDRDFGKWGPERAEFEFNEMAMLRERFKAFNENSKDIYVSALAAHLAKHKQIADDLEKQNQKPLVRI
jgi:hypothetical protein